MPGGAKINDDGAALRELHALEAQRPELARWLHPLGLAIAATSNEPWRGLVPLFAASAEAGAPVLHNAIVQLPADALHVHVRAIIAAALGHSTPDILDATALLHAAIAHDDEAIAELAAELRIDTPSLTVAAQLAALTVLHVCAQAADAETIAGWTYGYCPVCGSQPTLAEVLGLERRRSLRCGRCGAGWHTDVLRCAFCGELDHNKLGSLVPEGTAGQLAWVETCDSCHGYLKVRAALRAARPHLVLIEDARSVELDVAAVERGFHRPDRPGFAVHVRFAPASLA